MMHGFPFSAVRTAVLVSLILAAAGCGGGGGGGGGGNTHENTAPVARAGADQSVNDGATVTLDATASTDVDNDTMTYAWKQTEGPAVALQNADKAKALFVAPALPGGATLEFKLTVSDGNGGGSSDSLVVTVKDVTSPTASYPSSPTLGVASDIVIGFDEPVDADSLTLDGDFADATVTWNDAGTELTLAPPADGWESGLWQLSGAIADAKGNMLELNAEIGIRILFDTFQAASGVFGQADFTGKDCNQGGTVAADTLCGPYGQPRVSNGNLWIADTDNHRILGFDGVPAGNTVTPTRLVGQDDFVSNDNRGLSATTLQRPEGAIEYDNRLYVKDYGNYRILTYALPVTAPGVSTHVIGQINFTTKLNTCDASTLYSPDDMMIVDGRLIVVDGGHSRVLIWNAVPTDSDAVPADIVIGQSDMIHCQPNDDDQDGNADAAPSNRTLADPSGVWSDGSRLVVSDGSNNRVLIWNTFPTSNFQPADIVIGQSDFAHNMDNDDDQDGVADASATSRTLNDPYEGVWSNGLQLFVSDSGNNRVLVWNDFPTSNFEAADVVLGQSDFVHSEYNDDDQDGNVDVAPSARVLSYPVGLSASQNKLLLFDEGNNRLLIFTGH